MKDIVVVITGAARGIGREIGLDLSEKGAKVVISDIDYQSALQTAEDIKKKGGYAIGLRLDVTDIDQVKEAFEETIQSFGALNVLVNNAGIFEITEITETSQEKWLKTQNICLGGVFNCCSLAVPYLSKNDYSKIVNISSIDARMGGPAYASYCAAKAGVEGLTRALAVELAPLGINVNSVAPGIIETDMTRSRLDADGMKLKKQYLERIPLNRIGKPSDIANAVAFLASKEADYITGQVIAVNGGWIFY